MLQTQTPSYIIIHEDGTHTNLMPGTIPDDVYISNISETLQSQGRNGFLTKMEGNIRLSTEIFTEMQSIGNPSVSFSDAKLAYIKKNSLVRRRI